MTTSIKTADYILTEQTGTQRDMEKMFDVGYGERYTHIGGTLTLDTSDYEKNWLLKVGHVALLIIGSIVTLICFIIRECERAPIIAAHQVAIEHQQKIQTAYEALQQWDSEEDCLFRTDKDLLIEESYPVVALRSLMRHSKDIKHKQFCADILWKKIPLLQTVYKGEGEAPSNAGQQFNPSGCFSSNGQLEVKQFNRLIEHTLGRSGNLNPNKPSANLQELNNYDLTIKNWEPKTGWIEDSPSNTY